MPQTDLPEKIKRAREAASEFIPILRNQLASPDGRVHAGTILSAAAWLTGTSLYRAFHPNDDVPPGTIIKSAEINKEWESLMYLFEQYNFGEARIPVGQFMMAAFAAGEQHKPRVQMAKVQADLQEQYNQVMQKYSFDYLDGARAGVVLCSMLFQRHSMENKDIDSNLAAGLIAQGIIEAAKTAPPPLLS
jgi:hypothetical protein